MPPVPAGSKKTADPGTPVNALFFRAFGLMERVESRPIDKPFRVADAGCLTEGQHIGDIFGAGFGVVPRRTCAMRLPFSTEI